jgi:hypothetical protein
MYRDGQGVDKDVVQAHKWMNLAATDFCAVGAVKIYCVDKAREERNTLAQSMTAAQIAEAQGLARMWKPHLSPDPIPKRNYNMNLGKDR